MTAQEFYDTTVQHLVTQGRRAAGSDDSKWCRYRLTLDDGTVLKCAAGFHISDTEYSVGMEGKGVTNLVALSLVTGPLVDHRGLAKDLQIVHDLRGSWNGAGLSAAGVINIIRVAEKYKLTPATFGGAQ